MSIIQVIKIMRGEENKRVRKALREWERERESDGDRELGMDSGGDGESQG